MCFKGYGCCCGGGEVSEDFLSEEGRNGCGGKIGRK